MEGGEIWIRDGVRGESLCLCLFSCQCRCYSQCRCCLFCVLSVFWFWVFLFMYLYLWLWLFVRLILRVFVWCFWVRLCFFVVAVLLYFCIFFFVGGNFVSGLCLCCVSLCVWIVSLSSCVYMFLKCLLCVSVWLSYLVGFFFSIHIRVLLSPLAVHLFLTWLGVFLSVCRCFSCAYRLVCGCRAFFSAWVVWSVLVSRCLLCASSV